MALARWKVTALLAVAVVLMVWLWVSLHTEAPSGFQSALLTFHRPGWDHAFLLIDKEGWVRTLEGALEGAEHNPGPPPDLLDRHVLTLRSEAGSRDLWIAHHGRVYDPEREVYLDALGLAGLLSPQIFRLRDDFFGQLIDWREVHRDFHYDSEALLEDLETGRTFRIFRYGGIDHADCEPLTALDTAIMEDIYGGEWSWRRRAVIIHLDGRRLAGSMTGMPHMGYKIDDNDFDGHFCLHFKGSVIHGPRNVDDAHHVMYHKAAGEIRAIVEEPDPKKLATYLLSALGQLDAETALYMIDDADGVRDRVYGIVETVTAIHPVQVELVSESEDQAEISASLSVHHPGGRGETRPTVKLILKRAEGRRAWLADPGFLEQLEPDP